MPRTDVVAVMVVPVMARALTAPMVVPSISPAAMSTLLITTEPEPFGVMLIGMFVSVPSAESVTAVSVTPAAATFVSKIPAFTEWSLANVTSPSATCSPFFTLKSALFVVIMPPSLANLP